MIFASLICFISECLSRNGQLKQHYEGENNKEAIVNFMKNPDAPPVEKPKEAEWSDEPSDVVHLTSETFDSTLKVVSKLLLYSFSNYSN